MNKPQTPADYEQRLAAIDPGTSIILQAPAGSGKTEILIQRFLSLLALVKNPEEVVALTFTNKAANEMLERVLNELILANNQSNNNEIEPHKIYTIQLAQKVLAQDKKNSWNILDNPGRLQIKTFDSLCLSISRRAPLLSKNNGIDTPSDDIPQIYIAVVNQTLSMLDTDTRYGNALKTILMHLANDTYSFKSLLANMLAKRDQWLRLGLTADSDLTKIENILSSSWDDLRQTKVSALQSLFNKQQIEQFIYFNKYSNDNLEPDIKRPNAEFDSSIADTLRCFKNWATFALTGDLNARKTVDKRQGFPVGDKAQKQHKADFLKFLDEIKSDTALLDLWKNVISLPQDNFNSGKWQLIESILVVLKLAIANLKVEFSARGEVDYVEIAQAANQALGQIGNPSNLALYLDNKISHILIDEFQDTNHSQFEFLEKLTLGWSKEDGQTIFIVGDPMQSIYGFREADVGLFLKAKSDGINDIKLKSIKLKVNFRSSDKIVSWINNNFQNMFPDTEDYLSGAISFSKSEAFHKFDNSLVNLHGFYGDDTKHENLELIKIVKKSLLEYKNTPDKKIAVLVRSRNHLTEITKLLNLEQISYRALEMNKLNHSQTVEDLRNLSRAMLHLADKAAWLAVLRAPWCGMTLRDLQALVDVEPDANIWDLLNNSQAINLLSKDGKVRTEHIVSIFKTCFSASSYYEPNSLIEKLWLELGGDKYITQHEKLAGQMFFECLSKAQQPWGISIDQLDYELDKFYAPDSKNLNCQLECMTIHKAKGLEFDTVILPMLGKGRRGNDPELIRWSEHIINPNQPHSLLLAPIKAKTDNTDAMYDYLGGVAKLKTQYEEMRVLYVAATRAKKHLHLFATVKDKNGEPSPVANSYLSLLKPAFGDNFQTPTKNEVFLKTTDYPYLKRRNLKNLHTRKLKYTPYKNMAYPLFAKDDPKIIAGIVFHALCEQISIIGLAQVKSEIINSFIDLKLKSYLSDTATITTMAELVKTAINNTIADKTGKWLLSNQHQQSRQEWQISSLSNGKLNKFIIDRSFIEDDVIWIIDYKLIAPNEDEKENVFLKRMLETYQPQMDKYRSLVKQIDSKEVKTMLYFPLISKGLNL